MCICCLQFTELRASFDLEEDFVIVVRDLDVEMFARLLLFRLVAAHGSAVVLVRHFGVNVSVKSGV